MVAEDTSGTESGEVETTNAGDWRQAAADSLGGRPLDYLTAVTYEGISIQPLYTSADTGELSFAHTTPGAAPFVRGGRTAGYLQQPWLIAQELSLSTPAQFNTAVLSALDNGQTAVHVVTDAPTRAGLDPDQAEAANVGRGGVSIATHLDWQSLLSQVSPEVPLIIQPGTSALPLFALLLAHQRDSRNESLALTGWLSNDPYAEMATSGTLPIPLTRMLDETAQLTRWAAENAPRFGTVSVNMTGYHEAGATAVQELAFMLASAVQLIRDMRQRGLTIETLSPHLRFELAVGPQFFMEIAKIRAARLLWSQVAAVFGGSTSTQRMFILARTGRYNKTLANPSVNMVRVTTEALSAVLGGVDSLHVSPFDESAGTQNDFSNRIARNVQNILREEVHLTRMIDPAGGTWAVESLVNSLAQEAWSLFQAIEAESGLEAALRSGSIQNHVAAVQASRATGLATRKDVVVGLNQFVDSAEQPLSTYERDEDAIYRQRSAELADYRLTRALDYERSAALDHLAAVSISQDDGIVEAAIAAATTGATLGEITRALRTGRHPRTTIVPLTQQRAAVPFEVSRRDEIERESRS